LKLKHDILNIYFNFNRQWKTQKHHPWSRFIFRY
jgi:hypothetical protein